MRLAPHRLAAAAAVATALATLGPGGTGAPAATGAYRILLVSNRDGEKRAYSVLPDGSRLTPLLRPRQGLDVALLSRDGTTIAYTKGSAIYVSGSDGTGLRRLVPSGVEGVEEFSPDGKQLVFSTNGGLRIVPTKGGRVRRLTSYGDDLSPDWSPDGRSIVFARYARDGSYAITVLPLRGRRRVVARTGPNYGDDPSPGWSPDGRWIAYAVVGDAGRQNGIWIVRSDSKQRHRVTPRIDTDPDGGVGYDWSADGRWLATDIDDSNDERKNGLWLVRPNGKDRRRVTAKLGYTWSWSPDGKRLAYTTTSDEVVVVGRDGSGARRLKLGLELVSSLSWSPDGRRLAFTARSGSALDHIWTVASDLRGLRRVTSEGSNDLFGWTRLVPVPPPAPPIPASDQVVGAETVATAAPVTALAADGTRVAFVTGRSATDCDHVAVWSPGASSVARFGPPQAPCSIDPTRFVGLALAGSRVAWVEQESESDTCTFALVSATLEPPRSVLVGASPGSPCGVEDAYHLRADDGLLVFDAGSALVRIGAGSEKCGLDFGEAAICSTIRRGDHSAPVDSVSGRLIAIRERGSVAVVDDQGQLVRLFPFSPADVSAARLDGGTLVVWRFGVLEAYDVASGARELSRPLPSGFRLVDVDGGIAVLLSTDSVMLLRLADGRSTTLQRGQEPTLADLEPPGLYYSYATGDGGGRVVFIPRADLLGQLR
jgi:Tol biopolymer transport system component